MEWFDLCRNRLGLACSWGMKPLQPGVLLHLLQPQTSSRIQEAERQARFKCGSVILQQVCHEEPDFERAVVLEKCAQQVSFVPGPAFEYTSSGILERVKDIVKMDMYSLYEKRKNLEENVIHITSRFCHVGRVDEQNIGRLQFSEDSNVDILDPLANYPSPRKIRLLHQNPKQLWIGIYERALNRVVEEQLVYVEHRAGRIA